MIETENLILTRYGVEDAASVALIINDPDIAGTLEDVVLPFTVSDALDWIVERHNDPLKFTLAVRDKISGEVIGEVSGGRASETEECPQLRFHLRRDQWDKGYMVEAVEAAIRFAFDVLEWPWLSAECFDDDLCTQRMLVILGFEPLQVNIRHSLSRAEKVQSTGYFLHRVCWNTPVLKTQRLTLRPPLRSDAVQMFEVLNDAEICRMLSPVPYPYTLDMAMDWQTGRGWDPRDIYFVLDDGTGLIGLATLAYKSENVRKTGFFIGREHWNKGLMTEAVAAMLDWTFTEEGTEQVISDAFIDNQGSQRIHNKMGFTETDTMMQFCVARDCVVESLCYAIDREKWLGSSLAA